MVSHAAKLQLDPRQLIQVSSPSKSPTSLKRSTQSSHALNASYTPAVSPEPEPPAAATPAAARTAADVAPGGVVPIIIKHTVVYTADDDTLHDGLWHIYYHTFCVTASHTATAIQRPPLTEFKVTVVQGGITNALYRCSLQLQSPIASSIGDTDVLVRCFGKKSEDVIDRPTEDLIVDYLSQCNFACAIYSKFSNGRVEQWLSGRSLSPPEMLLPHIQPLIAAKLAAMHALNGLAGVMPVRATVWQTIDRWLSIARTITFDDTPSKKPLLQEINLPQFASEYEHYKTLFQPSSKPQTVYDSEIVFAHNDLLSGNVMYDCDTKIVNLVDFEYGAYNPRAFDISNHFCECSGFDCEWELFPSKKQQIDFMRAYLQQWNNGASPNVVKHPHAADPEQELLHLYVEVQQYALLPHFFWGIWAILQSAVSLVDFDYLAYSKRRVDGYWLFKEQCMSTIADPTQLTLDVTATDSQSSNA